MADSDHEAKGGASSPRSAKVAIAGAPNAGKSTLLNLLLEEELVIATNKRGTTRHATLGIYLSPDETTQIVFVDTPGLHRPTNALGRRLVEEAEVGFVGVDGVLLVVDALWAVRQMEKSSEVGHSIERDVEHSIRRLEDTKVPIFLLLNKVDLIRDKAKLLRVIEAFAARHDFAEIVPISAKSPRDRIRVLELLQPLLQEGFLFEKDALTDRTQKFFSEERIREAALEHLHQEIPHGVACVVEVFEDLANLVRIEAKLIVEKKSHKSMVIGKKGKKIKEISTVARQNLETFFGKKVFLKLWVSVDEGWTHDENRVRDLVGKDGLR